MKVRWGCDIPNHPNIWKIIKVMFQTTNQIHDSGLLPSPKLWLQQLQQPSPGRIVDDLLVIVQPYELLRHLGTLLRAVPPKGHRKSHQDEAITFRDGMDGCVF